MVFSLSAFPADRSVDVRVYNNTESYMTLWNKSLAHGCWSTQPTNILVGTISDFGAQSCGFLTGTEGQADYDAPNSDDFQIYWDNPFVGSNSYSVTVSNKSKYSVKYTGGGGDHSRILVFLTQNQPSTLYSIVIASDSQAWRLSTGDPNSASNRAPWEALNNKVVDSINQLSINEGFRFAIINGDITEFGRQVTRDSFYSVYNRLKFPFLFGLGNHDYENNVGDCTEALDASYNACARWSVDDMYSSKYDNGITLYANLMPYNFSSDYNGETRTGSLAYSWDYGNMHFVQLQNYPTYQVTLDHYAAQTIYIRKSMDWLENDLKNALARNKVIVLNMHDYDALKSDSTAEERARFRDLVDKYHVVAIFGGHTHQYGEFNRAGGDPVFGNAVVYNSGALFLGDYLRVAINGDCFQVSVYNGKTGTPELQKAYDSLCGKH